MPSSPLVFKFLRGTALLAGAVGSLLITIASAVYFNADELPEFVIEKLPLPWEDVWMAALRVHVVAAAFSFPSCLVLSSPQLLKWTPTLHRWLGRLTGMVVLAALVPSGLYLSLFAKGGAASTAGFALSGVIVAVAMVEGIRAARRRDFVAHRRHVMHVLAQLSVAVTSRAMLLAFDALGVDAERAYVVSLWVPVVGSLLVVESLVPRSLLRRGYEKIQRMVGDDNRLGRLRNAARV